MMYENYNKKRIKKGAYLTLVMVFVITTVLSGFSNISYAVSRVDGIEAFPAEYQAKLRLLKNKHPNWTFTALNTGLNWDTVINAETVDRKSLIPKSWDSWWKRDDNEVVGEKGWVNASRAGVEHVMNPLNYLDEEKIFQFETLSFNTNYQNQGGVDGIFYATSMYQRGIQYYDANGSQHSINKTYAQVVFEAAQASGVSPYHLASRIRQETGCDIINNLSICGRYHPDFNSSCVGDYRGIYNFYNIGASGAHPVANGLKYAKTPGEYGEPWDNPEKSIKGGALFLRDKYIGRGQNTLYLEKFNVSGNNNYNNQYMTNIMAPSNEATSVYKAYKSAGNGQGLDYAHNFTIPVYSNMPGATNTDQFVEDNTRIFLDAEGDNDPSDTFNIRSGASSSSAKVYTITLKNEEKESKDSPYIITRTARGIGIDWDKVKITDRNGTLLAEGYVAQCYVKVLNYPKITNIELDKLDMILNVGSSQNIIAKLNSNDAWYKDLTWSSNDEKIATVDQNGKVTAKQTGEAKITVTAKETGASASCNIVVTNPNVEQIYLNKTEYTIMNGNTLEIKPIILPETAVNKKYTAKIENTEIAEVLANGNIKAKKAGETKITFTTEDQGKTAVAKIKVVDLGGNVEFEIDQNEQTGLRVNGNEISKINPGMKVSDIKSKIKTNLILEFKDLNGNVLSDDKLVGTGTKIIVKTDDAKVYELETLIYGDITGDGVINSADLLKIRQYMLKMITLEGIYFNAANITKTDGVINSADLLKMRQHLLGSSIEQ